MASHLFKRHLKRPLGTPARDIGCGMIWSRPRLAIRRGIDTSTSRWPAVGWHTRQNVVTTVDMSHAAIRTSVTFELFRKLIRIFAKFSYIANAAFSHCVAARHTIIFRHPVAVIGLPPVGQSTNSDEFRILVFLARPAFGSLRLVMKTFHNWNLAAS